MVHVRTLAALLLLGACALTSALGQRCPESFALVGSRCLYVTTFKEYYDSALPWSTARQDCTAMTNATWSVDLLHNFDAKFLRHLTKHMINTHPETHKSPANHWVGVQAVAGNWKWLDGTPIDPMSYIWYILAPEEGYTGLYHGVISSRYWNLSKRYYLYPHASSSYAYNYVCEARPAA